MKMQLGLVTSAIGLLVVLGGLRSAQAGVVYSQDFEAPVTLVSNSAGPSGYVGVVNDAGGSGWQIQGGDGSPGGLPGISGTGGIDNNGVGGSQGLFVDWDLSPSDAAMHGYYTYNQETVYGLPAFVAGTQLSDVTISLDIYMDGSTEINPIDVGFQVGSENLSYKPTLTNGQYTHVSFTLDQATGGTPDLTMQFNLGLSYSAGSGFGFDAGNIVRIDNVQVTNAVPEPGASVLLALGGIGLVAFRRRG